MVGPKDIRSCLNCANELATESFCPACGQATRQKRITFRETTADFLGSTCCSRRKQPGS